MNKLSLVSVTPIFKYQRKKFIFKEIFAFQNTCSPVVLSFFMTSLYRDLVENVPFFSNSHKSTSLGSVWIQSIFGVLDKYNGFVKYFGFRVP
jgi:hypothetical protein